MICDRWGVVAVPFPFSDQPQSKRRPALVLSAGYFNRAGHSVFAMITTKGHRPWPGDTEIQDLEAAGLPQPCILRLKLFTLDNRLVLEPKGRLAALDTQRISSEIVRVLEG